MQIHDGFDDGEAKAGALTGGLGGVEGLEDFCHVFLGDAGAGVVELGDDEEVADDDAGDGGIGEYEAAVLVFGEDAVGEVVDDGAEEVAVLGGVTGGGGFRPCVTFQRAGVNAMARWKRR